MIKREFLKAGHLPTLLSAFFYFDMSFMVWVILGPLGIQIASSLHLDAAQKGLMVALPALAGAFLRVAMGVLVDRGEAEASGHYRSGGGDLRRARRLAFGNSRLPSNPAFWRCARNRWGLIRRCAAVGLALVSASISRNCARNRRGRQLRDGVRRLVRAESCGCVRLGQRNWPHRDPLTIALIVYVIFARDSPNAPPPKTLKEYAAVLKLSDSWWFMFFYAVTFGGFSGLASSLSIYFNSEYGLSAVDGWIFLPPPRGFRRVHGAPDRRRLG